MALFSKNTEAATHTNQEKTNLSKEAISSVISEKMRIQGEITFQGKARIDGVLEGNLEGEYLVLSETGIIQGDMQLVTLICHGKITGSVVAESLTVHRTATINGKVVAGSLTVEPGASLSGEINATKDKKIQNITTEVKKKEENKPINLEKTPEPASI